MLEFRPITLTDVPLFKLVKPTCKMFGIMRGTEILSTFGIARDASPIPGNWDDVVYGVDTNVIQCLLTAKGSAGKKRVAARSSGHHDIRPRRYAENVAHNLLGNPRHKIVAPGIVVAKHMGA